ncbi:MAG: M20/M25/M40 family metallo-hydrolase [Pseudomonadota bacterium]|nr:M20/M25/M40 family metallo-hydrolase [Pseudomonadota bacterium]
MRGNAKLWLVVMLLMVGFAVKGMMLAPPAVPHASAFDTGRAIGRLDRVLGDQRQHPVDSDADDAVRGRLVAELRALGLDPQVRARKDCRGMPKSRTVSCSRTHNVVAVIGGDRPGKALLLNAHYDSTPTGPGAADDGIGVATLLEVAANLQARPPAHPVILLFNEGEEYGLNGAGAFVDGDPLAAHVGALINIEARGVSGPAVMFETSEPNGAALGDYAGGATRPYANSLMTDLARLIPNYTDVVVFKDKGWRTLSFAITGNETRYHSPGDTVQALSRDSLYHMGSEVLTATQRLDPAPSAGAARWAYADIAGRVMLRLPLLLAALLLGGLLLGSGLLAWRGKALGRPLLIVSGAVMAAIVAGFVTSFLAGLFRAGDYWRATPLIPYLALYASLLAAELGTLRWLGGKVEAERLRLASWLLVLLCGAALSIAVPGATIFFLLGPALAVAGLAIPKARTPLLWAGALIQLVMFAELLASLEMLLIDGPLWSVAPLAALGALPVLVEVTYRPARAAVAALTGLAAILWLAALIMPRSSTERPLAFTIDYVRDDGDRKAYWAVASKQAPLPRNWDRIGRWERGVLAYSGRTRWLAPAPLIAIPAGAITKLGEERVGNHRIVRLQLNRGGGNALMIKFAVDVPVAAMGQAGAMRAIDPKAPAEPSILRCSGRSCDGLVVELRLASLKPVAAKLITMRFALPPQGAPIEAMRPPHSQPQYAPDSSIRIADITL